MPGFQYAYCVACACGKEAQLAGSIERRLGVRALFALYEREEHKNGRWETRRHPLLPGYIFLYARDELERSALHRLKHFRRLLQYEDGGCVLRGSDLDFAAWVYKYDGLIGLSRAYLVDDRTRIIDGPLKEYEGVIQKINRQRRSALVLVNVDGQERKVWMSFQWMVLRDGQFIEFNREK